MPSGEIEWPRNETACPFEQVNSALKVARVRGWHRFHIIGGGLPLPVHSERSIRGRVQAGGAGPCRGIGPGRPSSRRKNLPTAAKSFIATPSSNFQSIVWPLYRSLGQYQNLRAQDGKRSPTGPTMSGKPGELDTA
jgi:hypothetical protein